MIDTRRYRAKRLFLARHGESEANKQKMISGQLDIPLTDKGRNQALWLCDVLKNEKLSAIHASSLMRSVETARPTADFHGLPLEKQDGFKEIHLGVLQGRVADESDLEAKQLLQSRVADKQFIVPDAESFQDFKSRVLHCLDTLLKTMLGHVLIVAHRNTNEVILAELLGVDLAHGNAVNIKNKYLYEIHLNGTPRVDTIRLGGEYHGKKFTGFKDD